MRTVWKVFLLAGFSLALLTACGGMALATSPGVAAPISPLPTPALPSSPALRLAPPRMPPLRPTPGLPRLIPPVPTSRPKEQVLLCPGPAAGERVPLRRACSQEEIAALARQDLAERLGVPLEEVEMVRVEEEWFEGDILDCPRRPGNCPERAYPGPIAGYRIVLAVDGVQYEYIVVRLRLIFLGAIAG